METVIERAQARRDMIVAHVCNWCIPLWVTPNMLTLLRLALAPIFFLAFAQGWRGEAIALFAVGVALDFIDGPIARTRQMVSLWGKVSDPFADKLFFLPPIVWLLKDSFGSIGGCIIILLSLEVVLIVLALHEWTFAVTFATPDRVSGANIFGKTKTAIEAVIVFLVLLGVVPANTFLTNALFFAAVVAAVGSVSGRVYSFGGRKRQSASVLPQGGKAMAGVGFMTGVHEMRECGVTTAMGLDGKPIIGSDGQLMEILIFKCINCGKSEGLHSSPCVDRPADPMI